MPTETVNPAAPERPAEPPKPTAAALLDYRDMVSAKARGYAVEDERLSARTKAVNKSAAHFNAHVELFKSRRAAVEDLARADTIETEAEQLKAEHAKATAALEAAQAAQAEATRAVDAATAHAGEIAQRIEGTLHNAATVRDAATTTLLDTADLEVKAKADQLAREVSETEGMIHVHRRAVKAHQDDSREAREQQQSADPVVSVAAARRVSDLAVGEETAKRNLVEAEKRLSALQAELAEVEARKFDPMAFALA